MPAEMITTVLIAIISAGAGGVVSGLFNRRKTRAEAEATVAQTAMTLMRETLDNTVTPLNTRIDQLEEREAELQAELMNQAATLEALNTRFSKLQLAFIVNERFINSLGYKPPIELINLESLTVEALREMALNVQKATRREAD